MIKRGIEDGSIRTDVDATRASQLLSIVVDGCCVRWLAGGLTTAEARGLIGDAVRPLRAEGSSAISPQISSAR